MNKIIIIYILISFSIFAENVHISQIDSSTLLFNQKVSIYLRVSDDRGKNITNLDVKDFTIWEESSNLKSDKLEVTEFVKSVNMINGVNFLLLVDNSGSMYRTTDNKLTSKDELRRISVAKSAISNFVSKSVDLKDNVSLASFNTNYTMHSQEFNRNNLKVLDQIVMPDEYNKTELYKSLVESLDSFKKKQGRKVVIVLSDGENIPYGMDSKIWTYNEVIDEYQRNGISIFAINFAGEADKKLKDITEKTGGFILNANKPTDLDNIYSEVKKQVMEESLITYRATMLPGTSKVVNVSYKDDYLSSSKYFSSTTLGKPLEKLNYSLLLSTLFSLMLIYTIWRIQFDKINKYPNLEILDKAPGVTIVDSQIMLNSSKTIIGGNESADLTIIGNYEISDKHTEIIFDELTKQYHLKSEKEIMVNNRLTKNRLLESGDVLNIAGTTIIFDE